GPAVGDDYYVVGVYSDVFLFTIHYLARVYSYLLPLFGPRIFTEYDRAAGSGCGFHSLRKRDRLPERGAFLESERAGRIHFAPDEEDLRLRNIDDASGIEAHVLIEVSPEQPVNIHFYQLKPLALLRLLIAVPRLREGLRWRACGPGSRLRD